METQHFKLTLIFKLVNGRAYTEMVMVQTRLVLQYCTYKICSACLDKHIGTYTGQVNNKILGLMYGHRDKQNVRKR